MLGRIRGQTDEYWADKWAEYYDEARDDGLDDDEAREWADDRVYEDQAGTDAYYGVSRFD